MRLSQTKKAILALIIANMLWGMGPPIFKWSFSDIHMGTLAFLRFAIPTIFLGVVFNKKLHLPTKYVWTLIFVGLCNISLNIAFYFLGISYTASINASIIGAASPIFLILGSMILLRERPSKKMLFGNLIGLFGILLIIAQPLLNSSNHGSFFGNMMLVLASISAVIGTIFAKKIITYYSPIAITFWSFVVGTGTFFPFFVSDTVRFGLLQQLDYRGLSAIFFGVFGTSLTAYFLSYWALKYIQASQTGIFNYLDPVVSVAIAIPLLAEYPNIFFTIGSILVFLGIYIAEKRINYHPLLKLFEPE